MNQAEFQVITCNILKARENSHVQGTIGFVFASHWLKKWRDILKPIAKRSNSNRIFTLDSHLKTALSSHQERKEIRSICKEKKASHS